MNYDSMNAERGDGENSTLKGTEKSRVEPGERCRRGRYLLASHRVV